MKSLLFAVSALGACALQAGAPLEKTLGRAAYAGRAALFADDAHPSRFADVVHNAWRFYDWSVLLK